MSKQSIDASGHMEGALPARETGTFIFLYAFSSTFLEPVIFF
jgi:hypothetical protein